MFDRSVNMLRSRFRDLGGSVPVKVYAVPTVPAADTYGVQRIRLFMWLMFGMACLLLVACGNDAVGDQLAVSDDENRVQVEAPSRADVLLIQRMRSASIPEIQDYMREVLAEELPADYTIPEPILNAADAEEATRIVGERFPQFYNKQGKSLIEATGKDPLGFRAMILESRAVRKIHVAHADHTNDSL